MHGLAASAIALARAEAALVQHTPGLDAEAEMPLETLLNQPQELALRQVAGDLRQHFPNQLPPRTGKRVVLLNHLQTQPEGQTTLGGLMWRWRKGWLRVWPESRRTKP